MWEIFFIFFGMVFLWQFKNIQKFLFPIFNRYVEVAASHYSHISSALSQTGKVYMWGQCRGQSITEPRHIRLPSTDDAFASFSAPPISWRIYNVGEHQVSIFEAGFSIYTSFIFNHSDFCCFKFSTMVVVLFAFMIFILLGFSESAWVGDCRL